MDGNARVKQFSLRVSLAAIMVALVLAVVGTLSLSLWYFVRQALMDEFRAKMRATVAVAAMSIDGDRHSLIRGQGDENTEHYKILKSRLQRILKDVPDLRFVYTFREAADGKFVFVVDAEEQTGTLSHVGEVYESPTESMRQALSTRKIVVEEKVSQDKWGEWLSAFAPVYRADGTFDAMLGVDVGADTISAFLWRQMSLIFIVTTLALVAAVAASWWISRHLSRSLETLGAEMGRIRILAFGSDTMITSRIQEVASMVASFNNMKRGLRSFRKYVPADVVTELIENDHEANVGAARRSITVFFSDIAGFTNISEAMRPEDVAAQLNIYFKGMSQIVTSYSGTVDKFIGDGMMAFWGAPKDVENHAVMAGLAAIECRDKLAEIRGKWTAQGMAEFQTRIGLHSGEAIVGNLGHDTRLSYTAIGDVVNLGARLEALNKLYGTSIIISEDTKRCLDESLVTRRLDAVVVHGRTAATSIYELVGKRADVKDRHLEFIKVYESAMGLYLARDFRGAAGVFADALRIIPGDKAATLFLTRCEEFVLSPPGEDWTGAIVLRGK